jgi:glycosyltransferase involved in cell wall biosynthesis
MVNYGSRVTVSRRPRVLLIAEAANPEWASVPLVGWSLGRALSELVDAHVATHVRNREAIERTGWRDGREFTAIDSERVARPVYRFTEALRRRTGMGWTANTASASLSYYFFEHLLWKRFGDAIREHRFDIVHRVTPLSPTTPSVIAGRCRAAGIPFVWGPINGGVAWPREFRDRRWKEGEWLSYVRAGHRLMPGYRGSRRDAAAILIGSHATWQQFAAHRERCVYLPENGIDPSRFPAPEARSPERPLRVAFVGRLVPYKGADMLLEAATPLVREGMISIDVIGDGPERDRLERIVSEAHIREGVTFHGWVPHTEVASRLSRAHLLAFPSIREFGGGVVLEAMAMGVVPMVVDYGGPAELVTDQTGFRVPLGARAEIVARFRLALAEIAADPVRIAGLSEKARRRVRERFTWDAKARQVLDVYGWVLNQRGKPDFGMPI